MVEFLKHLKIWFTVNEKCTYNISEERTHTIIISSISIGTVTHKYFYGSGTYCSVMTTLIVSNEEMEGIMKMARSLEGSGLLIKGFDETI